MGFKTCAGWVWVLGLYAVPYTAYGRKVTVLTQRHGMGFCTAVNGGIRWTAGTTIYFVLNKVTKPWTKLVSNHSVNGNSGQPKAMLQMEGRVTESEAFATATAGANANGRRRERALTGERTKRKRERERK
ncbi:hypothetical protein EDB85DRAFT_2281867 [Lactarius pseudohatsudake]|nr:hypothetical protein EDB85DRAFT_2281867 [Lactarius pseudohatsudake]